MLQSGLRDNVVKRLLEAIFRGTIQSGDRMVAQTLAKQFGVSATPVREALVQLASVGLIEILPNRGAVCLPFGECELRDIYHLRRVLEVEATRLACGRLGAAPLHDLRIGLDQLAPGQARDWSARAMVLDARLHELIAVGCDNIRLRYELDRYKDLMQSIREVVANQGHVQGQAVQQHLEIVDALLEANAEKACRAMGRHIDQTANAVVAALYKTSAV